MTRRERLEARAERRRQWAEARSASADAAHERVQRIADGIPFGQPILVGHHSERRARADQRRMDAGMQKAVADSRTAERHEDVAVEIDRQLRSSVFSDDPDAVERLEAQIADLEARRERYKAENVAYRREHKTELAAMSPYERSQAIPYASFSLSNLGARIREKKQRVERLRRDAATRESGGRGSARVMASRYGGTCPDCGGGFSRGDVIFWYRVTREAVCRTCGEKGAE